MEANRQNAIAETESASAVAALQDTDTDADADSAEIEDVEDAEDASRPAPRVDAADLVAAAMKRQGVKHSEDQAELDGHLSQLGHWAAKVDTLRNGLAPTVARATAELSKCGKAFESLPPKLQAILRGRHEGLELIGKMIHRLLDRLPELGEPPERTLPFLGEDAWAAILAGEKSRESADQRIREKLSEMSSKRYKALIRKRRIVDTSRQSSLQFLRTQVLPVLDGIEDGEKHSQALIARLKTTDLNSEERLETWYRAYATLHAELLGVLGQIEVRPLEVRCGTQVDYTRQEPFRIEADPDLKTEDVKAVTRTGYEFTLDESGEAFVLRPAQVIVVKNAKESNRA